jgi:putative ABC transport system substrate-binding protein
MQNNRQRILEFAARQRLPVVGDWGRWATEGALLSYGPDTAQMAPRAATYVDKILKGAKPADLPVEQPPSRSALRSRRMYWRGRTG